MNNSLIELEKKRIDTWNCDTFLKRDCNFNSKGPITTYVKLINEPKDIRILKINYSSWNCESDNKFKCLKNDFYNEKFRMQNRDLIQNISELIQRDENSSLIFE